MLGFLIKETDIRDLPTQEHE